MDSPVARLLAALGRELRHDPLLARRVVEEAADHLAEIVAAERSHGMSPLDAETEAVRRFGSAPDLARRFDRYTLPLRVLLALAAIVTVMVAGWLLAVTTWVLPSRDPAHVPMWRAIALAYLAFATLTFAQLVAGGRHAWLRVAVLTLALVAIVFGVYLAGSYVASVGTGGHSEGYLLLMGVLLAGHGSVAFADAAITLAIRRRLRAS